jgi:hypothetical protein
MKALTICQPYAHLVVRGEKLVENRRWSTRYRGPLAIHAGKSRNWLSPADEAKFRSAGDPLVFGAVVGIATLVDVLHIDRIERGDYDQMFPWLRSHAHTEGEWCWVLANALKDTGLPLALSTGGRTKFNRSRLGIPKTHALDAACVGEVATLARWNIPTLAIKCAGRGSYQRTRLDRFGFPRGYLMRAKAVRGFATGDLVRAEVPAGARAGTYRGRVAVRATGSFNIQTDAGVIQGISHRYCALLQRGDGYGYSVQPKIAPNTTGEREQGRAARAALSLPGMNDRVFRAK